MGISRDSRHKRRATGGRMPIHKKKRAFEKGRPIAHTKLVEDQKNVKIRRIRVRGGNYKFRALSPHSPHTTAHPSCPLIIVGISIGIGICISIGIENNPHNPLTPPTPLRLVGSANIGVSAGE